MMDAIKWSVELFEITLRGRRKFGSGGVSECLHANIIIAIAERPPCCPTWSDFSLPK